MTPFQIVALIFAGPLGLILLSNLIITISRPLNKSFSIWEAMALLVCGIVIAVSFLGIH